MRTTSGYARAVCVLMQNPEKVHRDQWGTNEFHRCCVHFEHNDGDLCVPDKQWGDAGAFRISEGERVGGCAVVGLPRGSAYGGADCDSLGVVMGADAFEHPLIPTRMKFAPKYLSRSAQGRPFPMRVTVTVCGARAVGKRTFLESMWLASWPGGGQATPRTPDAVTVLARLYGLPIDIGLHLVSAGTANGLCNRVVLPTGVACM